MARDPDEIERDIERARDALAKTLDELGNRANPSRLADSSKDSLVGLADNPKVRYALMGVGALVVLLVVKKIVS